MLHFMEVGGTQIFNFSKEKSLITLNLFLIIAVKRSDLDAEKIEEDAENV